MLRSLFLRRVARRHLGQIVGLGNGQGGVILEADLLGICIRHADGDRMHLAWPEVRALIFGSTIDESHQRIAAAHEERRAPRPERKALSDEEIAAATGRDADVAAAGAATIIALGSGGA